MGHGRAGYGRHGHKQHGAGYNPSTNTWSAAGSLGAARNSHTATLLITGNVLISGGSASGGAVEYYDPTSGATSGARVAIWAAQRGYHTATMLPSGKVIVAGGQHDNTFLTAAGAL